ncbi:hypothetical protein BH11CYA1_BH11CYA1_42530 [soil metagenome]
MHKFNKSLVTATCIASLISLLPAAAQEQVQQMQMPIQVPAQMMQQPQALSAPTLSFVDINSGRFSKLEIDMQDGQFLRGACDNLHITARNLDLNLGELKSLDLEVKGGNMEDFIVDKLTLTTQGALKFDTGLLLNQKVLQFTSPATAQVTAIVTQDSLNKYIKAPSTLDKLSYTVTKKGGVLAGLLGAAGGNFGLTMTGASVALGRNNKVSMTAEGKAGIGQLAVPLAAQLESQLSIQDGWVQLGDTKLMTAGQEISPQLSEMLVKKINGLSNLGTKSDDIHFSFTDLKVTSGKQLVVSGTAQVNRLRFGRN